MQVSDLPSESLAKCLKRFSVVKNVNALMDKKTSIYYFWGKKPSKHHSTKLPNYPVRVASFFYLFHFPALPVKIGEVFEWVFEGLG